MKPELIKFVSGTKAKASEVNENFEKILNYAEKASAIVPFDIESTYKYGQWVLGEVDGKTGIYESAADDNRGHILADTTYWKYIFDTGIMSDLEEELISLAKNVGLPVFSANSGNTDANGNADLLYLPSMGVSTSCYFKVGGDYSNLVATNTEKTFEKSYLEPLNIGESGSRTYETWLPAFTSSVQDDITISPADAYGAFGQDGSYDVASGKTVDFIVDFGKETNVKGVDFEGFPYTQNVRHVCYFQGLYGTNDLLDEWVEILSGESVSVKQTDIDATYRYYKFPMYNGGNVFPTTVKRLNLKYVKTEYFADNNYNVFIGEDKQPYSLVNTIYRQKTQPTANINDVWLNTAIQPYKAYKYTGSEWVEFSDVPIGSIVVDGGIITSVETFEYNLTFKKVTSNMPSNKYIDLTLGASGSTYTAPANGWLILCKASTGNGQYIQFNSALSELSNKSMFLVGDNADNSGYICYAYMPMKKGQQTAIFYNAGGNIHAFRFVYAEGKV